MGVDADDVVGIEGSGRIPAHLEFPVVRGMYLDIYESEGHEFVYTVTKQWQCCCAAQGSGFGVWYGTLLMRSEVKGSGR